MSLKVGGRLITSFNDPALIRAFGLCHNMPEKTSARLEEYMTDSIDHSFSSMGMLRQAINGIDDANHLIIQFVHPTYNRAGGYEIEMSGNRTTDFSRANAVIGVSTTPFGYTWHHKEGIYHKPGKGGRLYCKMFLIKSEYHNNVWHYGAVSEYKSIRGGYN